MGKPAAITVTLNPAIDQTITVERLRIGSVQRAVSALYNAGGKGVNVAGCLADWGVPVAATGILGAANAARFETFFTVKGIADHFARANGETRTNIKIADLVSGETTDINLPGLTVDAAALQTMRDHLDALVEPGIPVALGGSLPPGLTDDAYAELCAFLRDRGAQVFLDTSGGPLARALEVSARHLPVCVKPNRHELEAWAGRSLKSERDLLEAARELAGLGIGLVVVSMGGDGALFVGDGQALRARLPAIQTISSVGAGDAMVAGLLAAFLDQASLAETARLAVSFARAKLGQVGPHLPNRDLVRGLCLDVELTDLN